ncbi:TetR family transcriptional regulator [Streptomyces sp. NPDC046977]|uniref:TetR/AcrR family transcriptional regulator n=1 Tax=Streptomyces sp. NPDC046977 TaxID=3154703 RepID=UPI0033E7952F
MSITDPSPVRRRRGRGARERILKAATELFTAQGINATGMDQLTAAAEVSKRTLYQHFGGKDELVHACLREMEDGLLPPRVPPEMTPEEARDRLLAVLSWPPPDPSAPLRGCPFLNAAVEVPDPEHPVHRLAASFKTEFARRLAGLARRAGARDPELLGEQFALLYDGAVARSTALNAPGSGAVARSIATSLLDAALVPDARSAG